MNDDEEVSVSETALQYDCLKFDDKQVLNSSEANNNKGNTDSEAAMVVYEAVDNCPEREYSHLEYK